ncbi:unnamed protein product [Microthlaspi erraticum]|uniref:Uncharacterized protein n=1 Tax=Microthlaspi erraticum TaxID=1685480 RepID=A0A6D2KNL9_9BRAS|nr:unnamed protein product [Microthlaspi erraticum]
MASSKAFHTSATEHIPLLISQHALYMAIWAFGAPPLMVEPGATSGNFTLETTEPAAIEDTSVPWPLWSLGDRYSLVLLTLYSRSPLRPSTKYFAPMIFLLQSAGENWSADTHSPFHFFGIAT